MATVPLSTPTKTTTTAVVSKTQQRIKLATSANSDGWLLVFDAFTSSGHQLVNHPADHFLTINTSGMNVFADFRPCPFEQTIRLILCWLPSTTRLEITLCA